MTAAKAVQVAAAEPDAFSPVLSVGDKVFSCRPEKLPYGTLLRYAENDLDLRAMHHLVVKLAYPDQLDAVWDAFDEVGIEASQRAIVKALEQYTARPTK